MALASKKHTRMYSTEGSDGDKVDSSKLAKLEAKFNSSEYILDDGQFEMLAPILYQMQQMQNELEELRRYLTAEVGDGAKGNTGTAGARGPAGSTGSTGAAGSDGSAGARGAAGADGSDGSSGARGASGAAGARGAAGADGSNASVDLFMRDFNGAKLPTRPNGLSAGKLWNNRGVITMA